ncbi:MAG TPA: TrbI/VirB10 family protein, partial [Allosphingosinicella sp.]|nr:TrbI/VirB10 family protein [Allosphingosinicella sp.]
MSDEQAPVAPGGAAKVDPESFVLRGRPARVVRFRRGVIVGLAAFASAALVGTAWLALKPATFSLVASGEDRSVAVGAAPDALAGAPRTYGDVPRLGPPLPGDLGRPILERQREMATERPAPRMDPAAQAAEAERQRRLAEARQAREAPVLMQLARAGAAVPGNAPAPAVADPAAPMPDETRGSNGNSAAGPGQAQNLAFVSARETGGAINPHRLQAPASRWQLSAGSMIAASLITGLNSDLPGLVVAQVTENAYDSATGLTILVPQGARLIGRYDSVVAFGQSRALLIWQRIVFPDGSSVQLDNVPATDVAGYAGIADSVDFHTWRLLRGIGLSTLLGVGTELGFGEGEGDLLRSLRESIQENAARAGDRITQRNLDIQPTLRVRPGWPIRAIVHKDLVLRPWRG